MKWNWIRANNQFGNSFFFRFRKQNKMVQLYSKCFLFTIVILLSKSTLNHICSALCARLLSRKQHSFVTAAAYIGFSAAWNFLYTLIYLKQTFLILKILVELNQQIDSCKQIRYTWSVDLLTNEHTWDSNSINLTLNYSN